MRNSDRGPHQGYESSSLALQTLLSDLQCPIEPRVSSGVEIEDRQQRTSSFLNGTLINTAASEQAHSFAPHACCACGAVSNLYEQVGPSEDRPVSCVFPSWAKVRATLSNTNKPLLGFQNLSLMFRMQLPILIIQPPTQEWVNFAYKVRMLTPSDTVILIRQHWESGAHQQY